MTERHFTFQSISKKIGLNSILIAGYKRLLPAPLAACLLVALPPSARGQHIEGLEDYARQVTLAVETQASSGSGVIIGKKGNRYALITAAHVIGGSNKAADLAIVPASKSAQNQRYRVNEIISIDNRADIAILTFESTEDLPVSPILTIAPDYTRRSDFEAKHNSKGIEHYNPSLEGLRSYWFSGLNSYRYDKALHVLGDPIVAGISLPSASVKAYLYRFSPAKVIDKISGNQDGYNLLYLATSTVPGMSGGGIFGARRCPQREDWMKAAEKKGLELGQFMSAGYYGLIGVHGRSEEYGSTKSRSGVSLGIPLDDHEKTLQALSEKLGIPTGASYLRLVQDLCAKDGGF